MTTPSLATPQDGTSRPEPDAASSATQLSSDEIEKLRTARKVQTDLFRQAITQTPDFPKPGILFEDILPIFASPTHHEALLKAYELYIAEILGSRKPDVIVGLDARGFLFGPNLALRLGAAFVPVRKLGKLPGKVETAVYQKEYGSDAFAMQADSIKPGQTVVIVDDLIATGGSAAAAAQLVRKASVAHALKHLVHSNVERILDIGTDRVTHRASKPTRHAKEMACC